MDVDSNANINEALLHLLVDLALLLLILILEQVDAAAVSTSSLSPGQQKV